MRAAGRWFVWFGLVAVGLVLAVRPAVAAAGDPVGRVDSTSVRLRPSPKYNSPTYVVSGWAADPDSPGGEVEVAMSVDGVAAVTTGDPRPDVQARYPFAGPNSGWSIQLGDEGPANYCFYALNQGAGRNTPLGCVRLPPASASAQDPIGRLDGIGVAPGLLSLRGWAGDPDGGGAALTVRVYLDGEPASDITADGRRPDVNRSHPTLGSHTGYDERLPVPPGKHSLCLYAGNLGRAGNRNTTIRCTTVTVPGAAPRRAGDPDGRFERFSTYAEGASFVSNSLRGWAYDPNGGDPWYVKIRYLVYRWDHGPEEPHERATTTGAARPDVQSAHPAAGPASGWVDDFLGETIGVCAYAVGVGPGAPERFLGCR